MRVMVAALLLLAAAAPAAGAPWLSRAAWPQRAPRAGIAAWLACSLAVVASLALAGLVLAIPCVQLSTDPAMLKACLSLLRAQYASPAGAVTGMAGGLLAAAAGRAAWAYGSVLAAARRRRSAHDDVLAVIAKPGPAADVRIIDGDRPAVYCLPGRRRIVVTTGALARLDIGELDAVLAHERAHLSGRHHIVLALAVATAGVPVGALGAGGSASAQRIQRLINPPPRDSRVRRAVTYAALTAAAALAVVAFAVAFVTITKCPPAPHF